MKYTLVTAIAAILVGGGVGILIFPAFNSELVGYNLLGFIPVVVGLWPINIVLSRR